jgi:ABC-type methionine transport system permease subunit
MDMFLYLLCVAIGFIIGMFASVLVTLSDQEEVRRFDAMTEVIKKPINLN